MSRSFWYSHVARTEWAVQDMKFAVEVTVQRTASQSELCKYNLICPGSLMVEAVFAGSWSWVLLQVKNELEYDDILARGMSLS